MQIMSIFKAQNMLTWTFAFRWNF